MSDKEFRQLFMKIDADSNGSVEWNEFMNYMLLVNQTLSSMKKEHFEYIKSIEQDPPPSNDKKCHRKNITSILVLYPEDMAEPSRQPGFVKGTKEYRNHIKFLSGSQDGTVKVWGGPSLTWEQTIEVSCKPKEYMVLAIAFMKHSKRLVAASADRKISFFEVTNG